MFNLDAIATALYVVAVVVNARPTATLNLQLKFAVLAAGFPSQRAFAYHVGIDESRMSEIVRGWVTPSNEERVKISKALGRSQEHLFRHQPAAEGSA